MKPFEDSAVGDVFRSYPADLRQRLMFLRQLIFEVASKTEGVGALKETLKWGEPAYLTAESKSGSTIRIDRKRGGDGQYAMYFHCQTTLVDTFRTLFPTQFKFEGNRSLVFDEADELPVKELSFCIAMALTYHRDKQAKSQLVSGRSRAVPSARSRTERAPGSVARRARVKIRK